MWSKPTIDNMACIPSIAYPLLLISTHFWVCNVVRGETEEIRRKNYADVYNFILDLNDESENNTQFITKMQAVFCPNQPLCGSTKSQIVERSDVIELNEELTIGDKNERLADLASVLGICCPPCDCTSSCVTKGNCCPSSEYFNTSKSESYFKMVGFSCIQPMSLSYVSDNPGQSATFYFMVNQCFEDRTNETVVDKCESPTIYNMDEITPVTSLETGYTYWNSYCAYCNSDLGALSKWYAYIFFKQPPRFYTDYYLYPITVEKLQRVAANSIIYKPPFEMNDNMCLPKDLVRGCDRPATLFSDESIFLLHVCNKYYSPISTGMTGSRFVFRNIFCLLCERFHAFELRKVETTKCNEDDTKLSNKDISALLDFTNPDSVSIQHRLAKQGYEDSYLERCTCDEIYDSHKDKCRPLFCPVGEFMNKCQCQQPMKHFSGMPVQLILKIFPETQPTDDTTDMTLSALHSAIKKRLHEVVKNVAIAILATFKLETMAKDQYFVTAIRVQSSFGHDTKMTMKPFLRYRDTADQLKIHTKKASYSMELTGRSRIWLDTRTGNYKCRDADAENSTATLLYLDRNVHPNNQNFYQPLSLLMYCLQVELKLYEFEENGGVVTINNTSPPVTIYDYYRISKETPSPIRICADLYLPKKNIAHRFAKKISEFLMLYLLWNIPFFQL